MKELPNINPENSKHASEQCVTLLPPFSTVQALSNRLTPELERPPLSFLLGQQTL